MAGKKLELGHDFCEFVYRNGSSTIDMYRKTLANQMIDYTFHGCSEIALWPLGGEKCRKDRT